MIQRTPQEWADFLGMKVACFSLKNGEYEYRAFEQNYLPFSMKWLDLIDVARKEDANQFYKRNWMTLTKTLAQENYDSIFIPTKSGEYIMIRDVDENRVYEVGRLVGFEQGYKIPVKVDKWEKKTYVPYSKEDDAGSSDEQDTEHKAI